MISGFERLDVWKLSHELALRLWKSSEKFPRNERFGLTAQLRRAALAIPTNIAEGNARRHQKEYLRFCAIARGSVAEVRYLLRFAHDIGVMGSYQYQEFLDGYQRIGQMLNALISSLQRRSFR